MPAPRETGFLGRQALPLFMLLMFMTQIEDVPNLRALAPFFLVSAVLISSACGPFPSFRPALLFQEAEPSSAYLLMERFTCILSISLTPSLAQGRKQGDILGSETQTGIPHIEGLNEEGICSWCCVSEYAFSGHGGSAPGVSSDFAPQRVS